MSRRIKYPRRDARWSPRGHSRDLLESRRMSIRVGIVGVSGYGGGEALRLCAGHPSFEVIYVAGESSAGQKLVDRFPGIGSIGELIIQKWDPSALPQLDVLFASPPTGESKEALARAP